jgi:hypothetical protein
MEVRKLQFCPAGWRQRPGLSARALRLRQELGTPLDWPDRVKRMLESIKKDGRTVEATERCVLP